MNSDLSTHFNQASKRTRIARLLRFVTEYLHLAYCFSSFLHLRSSDSSRYGMNESAERDIIREQRDSHDHDLSIRDGNCGRGRRRRRMPCQLLERIY